MRLSLTTLALLGAAPLAALGAQGASASAARICLAPPRAEMAAGNTDAAAAATRQTLTGYLTGPSIVVLPLTSPLASQTREEARAIGCPFVLFTTLKQERNRGRGLLKRIAGEAVENGAYQMGGAARSMGARVAASAAASAARNLARDVKSNDEMKLEYRLERANGGVVLEDVAKEKASSDGQDLLTPLAERAAEAIVAAAKRPS